MKSRVTDKFRKHYANLPQQSKRQARRAYQRFLVNPYHQGLQFKKVHPIRPIYSVRISRQYRALGVLDDDTIIWFWIGSHADYDKLLSQI